MTRGQNAEEAPCLRPEQLQEALHIARLTMDQASDAIFWMKQDGGFSYVNDQACRALGYTREELLKLRLWDIAPLFPKERWEAEWAEYRKQPSIGSRPVETVHRRKDGVDVPVEVAAKHIWFGNTELHVAFVRDITERKQAAEKIRTSEERLRLIAETIDEVFWMADIELEQMLYISPAYERVWGRSREDLIARPKSFLDTIHPEDRPRVLAGLALQKQGRPFDLEYRIVRPDGSERWVWDRGFPIRSSTGAVNHYIGVAQDITERKRTEEAHARLAKAVEQAAEAIVISDAVGNLVYVNPAFSQITGYSAWEAIGQNPRFLKSGKHDQAFYREMWDTLGRGEVWTGRITNRKKGGALYEEEMTISPVLDSSGKTANYVAVKRDITQEVVLESQLRQSQKMDAIGQLAGGVAHDFNNILTVIQGNASLLLNARMEAAERSDHTQQILRAAGRAATLTRQLLLFSRRQVMQPANLDMNEVVGDMTKMLKRILGEDVALRSDLASSLPPVYADAGMIEQVILNLAVNSRDAMPGGGQLTIATSVQSLDENRARQIAEAAPGRYVCVSLTDTGAGIPAHVLPHVFEPFFTTKEVGKGTGLGLATVYGIVQQHRGWITVDSEVGTGTTVQVYLPALEARTRETKGELPRVHMPRGSETILVVEDEAPLRLLVGSILQRCGYTVLGAASGVAALDTWKEHGAQVDLLLTDLVMPDGLNGRDLADQLRHENPQLKVIYTSGYSAEAGKGLRLIEGVNFLPKPYSSDKLTQAVRARLDGED